MSSLLSRVQWNADPLQRLTFPVTALLVVAVAYGAARLTWDLLPESAQRLPGPSQQTAQEPSVAGVQGEPLEVIGRWQLFGEAAPLDGTDERIEAPETRLALALEGVFYSPDPGRASAIISDRRRGARQYRPGDEVAGGRIEAIYENRVVLRRGGSFETLSFDVDRVALDRTLADQGISQGRGSAAGTADREATSADARDELERYRQQLAEDPRRLSQMVGLQPATEDGEMVGVRVTPGQDERIMDLLGLEPDDIVVSIDGTTLDNPNSAFQAVQGLTHDDPIELRVRRNGADQTIQIDFN